MDTLQELVDVTSRVAGHVTADPLVMDAVTHTEAIRHHGGKAAQTHSWTGEGAGGEDVVVDGGVGWVCVQTVQRLALRVGQVSHGKQVTVKALAWIIKNKKLKIKVITAEKEHVCVFWHQFDSEIFHFSMFTELCIIEFEFIFLS